MPAPSRLLFVNLPSATSAPSGGSPTSRRGRSPTPGGRPWAAGGTVAGEPIDHGFMYGRSFHDLDGHLWEVMWMSPGAVEAGPPDMLQSA